MPCVVRKFGWWEIMKNGHRPAFFAILVCEVRVMSFVWSAFCNCLLVVSSSSHPIILSFYHVDLSTACIRQTLIWGWVCFTSSRDRLALPCDNGSPIHPVIMTSHFIAICSRRSWPTVTAIPSGLPRFCLKCSGY